jgi:phosphoserine phosphatase RsbU/P
MNLADPQFARSDVLRVFNHAQIYLFLGSCVITVGLLAAALSLLRRCFDALLLWFALFAILYGVRLEMNYQLLWALGLRPIAFQRLEIAIDFLIPIPGFFFLRELNLIGRVGRVLAAIVWPVAISLAVLTLFLGPQVSLRAVNNTFIIAVFVVFLVALIRVGSGSSDITLTRRGLSCSSQAFSSTTLPAYSATTITLSPLVSWFFSHCLALLPGGARCMSSRNSESFGKNSR